MKQNSAFLAKARRQEVRLPTYTSKVSSGLYTKSIRSSVYNVPGWIILSYSLVQEGQQKVTGTLKVKIKAKSIKDASSSRKTLKGCMHCSFRSVSHYWSSLLRFLSKQSICTCSLD